MDIHISVRALVEFIYRHGDIDNRKAADSPDAMQVGSRIHRKIQSMMGPEYRAEYPLSYTFGTEHCSVTVEGRADGIMRPDEPMYIEDAQSGPGIEPLKPLPAVLIDEIKSTVRNVSRMTDPEPVHLAQALCYAAIYLMQEDLPEIGVRMTYVTQDTEEIRYFYSRYSADEIRGWFDDTCEALSKWVDMQAGWTDVRQASIQDLEFPYDYRPGQKNLVEYVYRTIYHGRQLYIEAPTGTGKTLSVLYPAIRSMGEGRGDRIFYLTARTIARTVAEEALTTLKEHGLKCKNITLTAKEKICFADECDCNPEACPYAKGHFDRINEALFAIVTGEETFTRDTIERYAREYEVCPFEFALDISLFSDCIIGDYNYVFDPNAYLRRFFAEGREGSYIFLIDEAHNLVDRGREMYSATLVKEDLLACKRACSKYQPAIARAIEKCNKDMLAIKRGRGDTPDSRPQVMPVPGDLLGHAERLSQLMSEYLADHTEGMGHEEILDLYFKIRDFLNIYDLLGDDYCIYNAFTEERDFFVKLYCVDPARNLRACADKAIASILFSATLLPIQYYKKLLGGTAEDYEVYAQSVFDTDRRLLIQATDVSSKYSDRSRTQYRRMAEYIYEIASARAGNYMVFAPSYAYMQQVYDIYMDEYHDPAAEEVVIQSGNMREADREEFVAKFRLKPGAGEETDADTAAGTLIGFCVLGGIFAEGIDLRDDALIGVIVMGTGLPQIGGERDLLRGFYDDAGLKGFDYAYSYPGMNRVQQAAGRLIRTETDRGVIALLDERFSYPSNRRMFPREWSDIRTVTIDSVRDAVRGFWKDVIMD